MTLRITSTIGRITADRQSRDASDANESLTYFPTHRLTTELGATARPSCLCARYREIQTATDGRRLTDVARFYAKAWLHIAAAERHRALVQLQGRKHPADRTARAQEIAPVWGVRYRGSKLAMQNRQPPLQEGSLMARLVYSSRKAVPVDALRLNEDIRALRQACELLGTVDRYNVADDPDRDVVWLCIQRLKLCQRHAEDKMRQEFLDPRRKKVNER